jgi:hypothetical protein
MVGSVHPTEYSTKQHFVFHVEMFKFDRRYFLLTLILLAIEVFIAIFIRDRFIRPLVGDVLVVILIYCLTKSFVKIAANRVAISVLIFAATLEILQYFQLVDRLGLSDNRIAQIVIGMTFDWMDLVAYTAGTLITIAVEYRRRSI